MLSGNFMYYYFLLGLKESNYVSPTEIQRESVIHALRGNDILGAAKTGSGKTLAFLIPVMYFKSLNKFENEMSKFMKDRIEIVLNYQLLLFSCFINLFYSKCK